MKVNWKDICKFLAGAFFVSSGVCFYFYFIGLPVPLIGTQIIISPEVNGLRAIVQAVFFLITLYLGFFRK